MREQISILTQSRFFSPVFNGAIFDGPVRIYFSQNQEAAAMKLYFALLNRLKDSFGDGRDQISGNIFVMIYPTNDSFRTVFPSDDNHRIQVDELDGDHVVGLNGPFDEVEFTQIFDVVDRLFVLLRQSAKSIPETSL